MSHEKLGLGLINDETTESTLQLKRVTESYQKALGALVIEFSLLTYLLETFSHEVFAVSEPMARIVLGDLPFTSMIRKLRECAKHRMLGESNRKKFLSILKRAEVAANQRNELMHALWIISEGEPVFCYRRRNKVHSQAPSIGGINELTHSIGLLTRDLHMFRKSQPLATNAMRAIVSAIMEQKNKQP